MPPAPGDHADTTNQWPKAIGSFLLGTAATAMCLQSMFADRVIADNVMSRGLWESVVSRWGVRPADIAKGEIEVSYWIVLQAVGAIALLGLIAGTAWQVFRGRRSISVAVADCAYRGWLWWLLPALWESLRVAFSTLGWAAGLSLLLTTLPIWLAVTFAGWLATLLTVPAAGSDLGELNSKRTAWSALGVLCAVYVVGFTWMNWQLYWALEIPHGDSAMYEEHLWNLTHGKGFRSYLDNGRLFLGEHVQVIHIALVPFHAIWPSQLLLELCESLALAAGAVPVFLIARRHAESNRIAVCLAAMYLLAFPLHFLDISIDTKTFRPISFGVPLMLFALDQWERGRLKTMVGLLLLAISAKEDFAVMVSMLGIWIAVTAWWNRETDSKERRRNKWFGIGLAVFGAVYVFLVIKLVIPAFRDGDPHYFRYFGELGSSPGDVLARLQSNPEVVFGKLFSRRSVLYALLLLPPLGFLPLLSPGRLATILPLFGVLCLLELTSEPAKQGTEILVPVHHFHAPILPFMFWAAAAGLGTLRRQSIGSVRLSRNWLTTFGVTSAVCTGLIFSFHPLSIPFWDAGSDKYWKQRYVPDERAAKFETVRKLIPDDARVFATDFVHTRLTHRRRSYDYSGFKRKSDEELTNPVAGETYYIVIDVHSRYSTVRSPNDVKEYRDHPDVWELVRHDAEDYFIVLKRRG